MKVYLDNGATTMTDPQVSDTMAKYFTEVYGNASSLHSFGKSAKEALDISRRIIADSFNADSREIIFTSGGTESDNLAIKGVAYRNSGKGKH
ncbi:MAG: aminotransferase class V-fold PLP-dependent enzyme, partial [Candidatus Aenigmarchaeota archaeon]|nr:aminotransferase class V-fold PLP-dependent enzyme [Candidatus Aenigmarchaeota archaeon]